MLILCAPDAALYNVNYVYGDDTIIWKLLAGMTIPNLSVEMTEGSTFDGWFNDANYSTALSGTVTGDTTIYGKVTTQTVTGTFLQLLKSGEDVTISTMEDWNVFVQNASLAQAGQVITLGKSVDCEGATYDSMTFSGRSAGGVAGFIRNADVRYCSSRDTSITGLANGGGIVGLSNAKIEYCYSTTTPTALPSLFGGSAGGVVGKNVRGAYTEYCWSTMKVVGGRGTGTEVAGTDIGMLDNVSDSTTVRDFVLADFTQDCWARAAGTATDFNTSVIMYAFT